MGDFLGSTLLILSRMYVRAVLNMLVWCHEKLAPAARSLVGPHHHWTAQTNGRTNRFAHRWPTTFVVLRVVYFVHSVRTTDGATGASVGIIWLRRVKNKRAPLGKKKKEKTPGKTRCWMMTRERKEGIRYAPAPHHLADVSRALSIDFERGACGDGDDGWKVDGGLSASHLTTKYSLTWCLVFDFWRRALCEEGWLKTFVFISRSMRPSSFGRL